VFCYVDSLFMSFTKSFSFSFPTPFYLCLLCLLIKSLKYVFSFFLSYCIVKYFLFHFILSNLCIWFHISLLLIYIKKSQFYLPFFPLFLSNLSLCCKCSFIYLFFFFFKFLTLCFFFNFFFYHFFLLFLFLCFYFSLLQKQIF